MKKTILKDIKESLRTKSNTRNSMGCSENYYNPNYMIGKCFTEEELQALDRTQLNNLIRLAEFASEVFY